MDTVGIMGGGTMGSGIAFVTAARMQVRVRLVDVSEAALAQTRKQLERYAAQAHKRGSSGEETQSWLARIQLNSDTAALADAELVVEAVPENMALKQDVFRRLDALVSPDTLLASNTSGLSITEIASATARPERVIGMHFFNPVPAMKLVELVTGVRTSEQTITRALDFCHSLGKETILARDNPGFVVTRVGQAMINEAIRCLEENVAAAADIDKGMRLGYNYPLGPLELADLVGLDTELMILESLHAELGEVFRPRPLLKAMVRAGFLGKKSGRGFYSYE